MIEDGVFGIPTHVKCLLDHPSFFKLHFQVTKFDEKNVEPTVEVRPSLQGSASSWIADHRPQRPKQVNSNAFAPAEDVYRARARRVQQACRNVSSKGIDDERYLWRLFVSDRWRCIYCAVPKVGSTNWKTTFIKVDVIMGGIERQGELSSNEVHLGIHDHMKLLGRYPPAERDYRLKNYFKFMFARYPFDRIYSAYWDKLNPGNDVFRNVTGRKIKRLFRRKNATNDDDDPVTLDEFARYLTGLRRADDHWSRIVDLCNPCAVRYDVIGKYETFMDDVNYVLDQLGLKKIVSFPIQSTHRDRWKKEFAKLKPTVVRKLYRKYFLDFVLFNYTDDT